MTNEMLFSIAIGSALIVSVRGFPALFRETAPILTVARLLNNMKAPVSRRLPEPCR